MNVDKLKNQARRGEVRRYEELEGAITIRLPPALRTNERLQRVARYFACEIAYASVEWANCLQQRRAYSTEWKQGVRRAR